MNNYSYFYQQNKLIEKETEENLVAVDVKLRNGFERSVIVLGEKA